MFSNWQACVGIAAGALSFAAYLPYAVSILRGKTKPHRTTWLILTIVVAVTTATYKSSGAENTLWLVVGDLVGTFVIALLSIRYGVGGNSKTDCLCLIGALAAMVIWVVFDSPVMGLVTILVTDLLALLPTMIKTYHHPGQEDRTSWVLTLSGDLVSLFAVEGMIFGVLVYPIYHALATGIVVALTFRKED